MCSASPFTLSVSFISPVHSCGCVSPIVRRFCLPLRKDLPSSAALLANGPLTLKSTLQCPLFHTPSPYSARAVKPLNIPLAVARNHTVYVQYTHFNDPFMYNMLFSSMIKCVIDESEGSRPVKMSFRGQGVTLISESY